MFVDYVINGQAHGVLGETLQGCRFDTGLLRPYYDSRNQRCVTINTGKKRFNPDSKRLEPVYEKRTIAEMINTGISSPVFNATSLRKDEWIQLDTQVNRAARARLRAWQDLMNANSYGGFDGMSKTILEHQNMSDPGEAVVDMDALTEGRTDSPRFDLQGLPLPITHSDFWYSARQLATSRNNGTPLDTVMAEAAGRRVAEMVERTLIGVETGLTYGNNATSYARNSTVYGYTNFPERITKTDLTTPTGTNPEAIMADVIEMRELLYSENFYGPFMLYHSTGYDRYLDDDYYRSGGTSVLQTLRQRIQSIDGIAGVRRLDFLTSGFVMIMVQMTSDVARAISGLDLTVVQWESVGGLRLNFKVMCIWVPQLRCDYDGRCGIVHGTTSYARA